MGEEAVVADALKAFGQNVQQEAADELVGSERHRFLSVAVAIVFPAEADPAFLDGKKAVVGESDAMGVSRDISQNLFGAGEGGLGIDAPLCLAGGREVAPEGTAVAKPLKTAVEGQLLGVEGLFQRGKEQPTEQTSEHADGQKELGPAGDPTAAVGRKTATGDDAMQVWMVQQGLAPSVKDGEEAELGAKMFGISGDCAQGFGSGVEQDVVDRSLVVKGEAAISCGTVKTTWKYGTGRSSDRRSSSHWARASDWHFGQWRFRQEL